MNIADLLVPERVVCDIRDASKKRVLQNMAELIASHGCRLSGNDIFESLIGRERLGSTGLGHGVAIPHARISGAKNTFGAFIKLNEGIDYDAPDHQPVDLLFALLVPEHSTQEHLGILAQLAEMFSNTEFCQRLRECSSAQELYTTLSGWQPPDS
jgi:PTS system nitrogen regulatory IIA component